MNKKIRNLFFIAILFSGFNFTVLAQTEEKQNQKIFGSFIIMPFEFTAIDPSQINNILSSANLPTINNLLGEYGMGLGLQLYLNRIVPTLSFNWGAEIRNDNTLQISHNIFSLNFGYNLLHNVRYSLHPYIGYKNCSISYLYSEKFDGTIEDYLSTNLKIKEISNSRSHIDFGIGTSLRLQLFPEFITPLNLRAGFLLPIQKSNWKANNELFELKGGPKLNYQYYFIFTIGMGWIGARAEPTQ